MLTALRLGGSSVVMGFSTGLITPALSTRKRTSSPLRSQRCQLSQSDCRDADHSHCQLMIEDLSSSATCWSVSVLQLVADQSDMLGVRRSDLCQSSLITAQTVWMCSSCLSAALQETPSCCVHFHPSIQCLENHLYFFFSLLLAQMSLSW